MRIGVVGLGKIGSGLATVLAKRFTVYAVDLNPEVDVPAGVTFSINYECLKSCEVVWVVTPTYSPDTKKFNLEPTEQALKSLHKVNPTCLAVIACNVNIGDCDKLQQIHKRLVYNPEFVRLGSVEHDFENPKFVIVGAYTNVDAVFLAGVWRKIHSKPVLTLTIREAEITKLMANVSYAMGITFANAVGELCRKYTVKPDLVLQAIYFDRRDYKVGLGFAGPCFPTDVTCLEETAREIGAGVCLNLACMLEASNKQIVDNLTDQIQRCMKHRIAVLGLAYKPNVPYTYNSQAIQVVQRLIEQGHSVYVYDSQAMLNAREALGNTVHYCNSAEEAVAHGDVVFIGTNDYSSFKCDKPMVNPWK